MFDDMIWGLIVSVVISGEFSGFNSGLANGFGSMIVAHILITLMVVVLAASLVEMATAFPFSSGCAAYTFAAFGGAAATIIGYLYTIEFITMTAQTLMSLGQTLTQAFELPHELEPIWWALAVAFCAAANLHPRLVAKFNAWMTLLSCMLLCAVLVVEAPSVRFQQAFTTAINSTDASSTNATQLTEPSSLSTAFLPFQGAGIVRSIPSVLYLYIGFESLTVFAEETRHIPHSIPRGTTASMFTLVVLATATLLITSAAAPGIAVIAGSALPHTTSLLAILNLGPTSIRLLGLVVLPPIVISLITTIFSSSRYIYALSRGGFLPTNLSLTNRYGGPFVATIVSSFLSFGLCFVINYGGLQFQTFFMDLSILSALLAYTFDMLVFVRLRSVMPGLPRPVTSPFGVAGAVFVMLVSALAVASLVALDRTFALIFVVLIGFFVLLVPYYVFFIRKNLTASPEKEFVKRQMHAKRQEELRAIRYDRWTGFGESVEPQPLAHLRLANVSPYGTLWNQRRSGS
nr:hypothetical protein HK105_004649 [Polyrhizophydium stewartii]